MENTNEQQELDTSVSAEATDAGEHSENEHPDNENVEEQGIQDQQDESSREPTKHAKFMRGVVTPIFGLLAVACIVLGIANATVWKPSSQISATVETGTRYIVSDPGVLSLVDQAVTISVKSESSNQSASQSSDTQTTTDNTATDATVDDNNVCIAVGNAKDIAGWLENSQYTRLTGLESWSKLKTDTVSAKSGKQSEQDEQSQVSFAKSDMWNTVECGKNEAKLSYHATDPQKVVIIDTQVNQQSASSGKSTSTVMLHWVRATLPDFAMPFYFAGFISVVLAVLSASVFAVPHHKRRNKRNNGVDDVVETSSLEEAPGETTMSIKPIVIASFERGAKSRKAKKGRHGRHSGYVEDEPVEQSTEPVAATVVDPFSRNIVAETSGEPSLVETRQTQSQGVIPTEHANRPSIGETTTVISNDEFAAYFARLSQEQAESQEQAKSQEQTESHGEQELKQEQEPKQEQGPERAESQETEPKQPQDREPDSEQDRESEQE